jgi:AraC-like DNA-binding protein
MEHNSFLHPLISKACQYIEEHHRHKITMADLAQYTNYSERSIQLIFKKHFEQSPFEYIDEVRMQKAFNLIQQHKTRRNITDIARDVGFAHLGRFSVNFRKRFGIHPSVLARS